MFDYIGTITNVLHYELETNVVFFLIAMHENGRQNLESFKKENWLPQQLPPPC